MSTIDGFSTCTLDNGRLAVVAVPELGGRLVSLRSAGGREWFDHPGDELRLWRNRPGDAFGTSTHAGLDECLPTVGACTMAGRALPDHGSCWAVPWQVLSASAQTLRLAVDLPDQPLRLERTATLDGTALRLDYLLKNTGTAPVPWGWAFHGLLTLRPGDRIELPAEALSMGVECQRLAQPLDAPTWAWPSPRPDLHLDRADLGGDDAYTKLFTPRLKTGRAALVGADGQRLDFTWDTAESPWLGLWITRGGYRGQHGVALEPTTTPCDRLDQAGAAVRWLAPGEQATWSVRLDTTVPPTAAPR